jgi:hypothetical protein
MQWGLGIPGLGREIFHLQMSGSASRPGSVDFVSTDSTWLVLSSAIGK